MLRFYLNIVEHDAALPDPDGSEFETVELARLEAVRSVRELVATRIVQGRSLDEMRIDVCDPQGLVLGSVSAHEVVSFE